MSLFAELRRRNVFRVSIAYIMSSWLLVEVADVVLDNFGAPEWVMQTIIALLLLGFPAVVFFAWAYEVTPEGLRREQDVDRSQSITYITGRKLDRAIIVLLLLLVGYFVYDKVVLSPERDEALVEATAQSIARESQARSPEAALAQQSIAVLPFVNMSPDEDQEYFSDGLSEELLNLLAKIPNLRVAARTSSFSFKGKSVEIPEIGRRLNVAHVLEGSVRKAGNRIRITAQLVKADDGFHLWSETYDRTLDNIFTIQDEIAAAVVDELKVKLLGTVLEVKGTDPDAYTLYLQALHLGHQNSPESLELSNALFRRVLEQDSDFAPAWTGLAINQNQMANVGLIPADEGFEMAREAATKALQLEPTLAMAHAILGEVSMQGDSDFSAAAEHLRRALELEPLNADVLRSAVQLYRGVGRLEEAIVVCEYMVTLDPLNNNTYYTLAVMHRYSHNLDDALSAVRTALELSPGRIAGNSLKGEILLHMGELDAALDAVLKEESSWRDISLPIVYHALGRSSDSDAALTELIEQYGQDSAYNIAYIYAYRGEIDRAFEWLERAVEYNDPGLNDLPIEWYFSTLHDDPRWLQLLERLGKSSAKLDAIEFEVRLPQ